MGRREYGAVPLLELDRDPRKLDLNKEEKEKQMGAVRLILSFFVFHEWEKVHVRDTLCCVAFSFFPSLYITVRVGTISALSPSTVTD